MARKAWKGSKRPSKAKSNAAKAKRQLNAFAAAIAKGFQQKDGEE